MRRTPLRARALPLQKLGYLHLIVVVTAASVQDREGAMSLLAVLRPRFSRLRLIWADQAYAGDLVAWLWALRPWRKVHLEIVRQPEGIKGFLLLPKPGSWSGPSPGSAVTVAYRRIMST